MFGEGLFLVNEGQESNDLVESKCDLKHKGLNFDHEINTPYQKESAIGFIDVIFAEDNIDNDDDGGEVGFV